MNIPSMLYSVQQPLKETATHYLRTAFSYFQKKTACCTRPTEENKTAKYHLYVQPWEDRFAALLHIRQVQEEGQDAGSTGELLLSPASLSLSFVSAEVRAGTLL
jgi:hypothetical protein